MRNASKTTPTRTHALYHIFVYLHVFWVRHCSTSHEARLQCMLYWCTLLMPATCTTFSESQLSVKFRPTNKVHECLQARQMQHVLCDGSCHNECLQQKQTTLALYNSLFMQAWQTSYMLCSSLCVAATMKIFSNSRQDIYFVSAFISPQACTQATQTRYLLFNSLGC